MFPQVTQITLVGLENIGSVPNAKQNTLLITSKDVKSLLKRSFFSPFRCKHIKEFRNQLYHRVVETNYNISQNDQI